MHDEVTLREITSEEAIRVFRDRPLNKYTQFIARNGD